MAVIFTRLMLLWCLVPLAPGYPFAPPTCYSKVLTLARELTQWAAHLKRDPLTMYCMAHMPELYLDVHNACVMHKMRAYMELVDGLRRRRCSYTTDVRRLGGNLRQLFLFMTEKCHGDLVFTSYDCSALE